MRMFQVCVCGKPLQLNEAPTPKPAGTEVLLKVIAAGVCHSDLHLSDGYFDLGGGQKLSLEARGMKLPVTLGHENVGEVVALGPEAKGVKVGDRVLADPWIGCGKCPACQRNEDNLCMAMRSLGVFSNGGYADYMYLDPHSIVHKVRRDIPANVAVMFNPLGAGFRWAVDLPRTSPGESVLVLGPGQGGLASVVAARAAGAGTILVTGIAPVMERSGKQSWVHWRCQCPKFLRQTLVEWAGLSIRWSAWAKRYYEHMAQKKKKHAVIVRQQADANESMETGWLDLIEWAAIALWKLSAEQQDSKITASVAKFWWDFYIAELERFYRTHIEEVATEQAVDDASTGSFVGTVVAAYHVLAHRTPGGPCDFLR